MSTFVIFRRGGARFAVGLDDVRRVASLRDVSPLPSPALDVQGVVADGSHIVPVIAAPLPPLLQGAQRTPVLLLANGESPFGFLVEEVEVPRSLFELGRPEDLPPGLGLELGGVPREAIQGVMSDVAAPVAGLSGANLVTRLVPGPLYRARALPEDS